MIKITENGFIQLKDSILGNAFVLSVSGEAIALDPNFTLRSFFKMFVNYPKLAELEAHLNCYVDLYSYNLSKIEPIKNNNKILFKSYLVNDLNKRMDVRHNLIVQSGSGHNSTIDRYKIEEILDSKIILSKTVWTYKIEEVNGKRDFIKMSDKYPVETTCNLHEFILWSCGSLFKGRLPEARNIFVEENNKKISKASNLVMQEIEELLKI